MTRRRLISTLCVVSGILAATVGGLLLGLSVEPVPLNGQLRHDAVVHIVGWVVEDRALLSFQESYPDAEHMEDRTRFYVACDFLPLTERISNDPRVVRIAAKQEATVFAKEGFGGNDYLVLTLLEEGADYIKIEMSNMFGGLAGHGYQFTFRTADDRLTVEVKFLWVS